MSTLSNNLCSYCQERIDSGETDFNDLCIQCKALNGDTEAQKILFDVVLQGLEKNKIKTQFNDFILYCLNLLESLDKKKPPFLKKNNSTKATDVWLAYHYHYRLEFGNEPSGNYIAADIAHKAGCGIDNINTICIKNYKDQAIKKIEELMYVKKYNQEMYLIMLNAFSQRVEHAISVTKLRNEERKKIKLINR